MDTSFTSYWQMVLNCLVRLADMTEGRAGSIVRDYRRRLLGAPAGLRPDVVYNMEPWQLALRLAGQPIGELSREQKVWYDTTYNEVMAHAAITGSDSEVLGFATVGGGV